MSGSAELFERAKTLMPGGVNSPVRAFRAVGGTPRFIRSASGATVTDEDGTSYIDYVGSWGPMILGHNHPAVVAAAQKAAAAGMSYGAPCAGEVELAQTALRVTGMEMIRMVNSGTEAVMSALRLSRGYTGRDKLIKFEGCYHGHCDSMLVAAGSGALTAGVPDSAGVPAGAARDTLVARYNDLDSVRMLLEANDAEVAAVIVEPVAANMGVVLPEEGFLTGLRELCDRHGALLIFDEVITGFRLGTGGAQAWYAVRADIATYGKILGGGMPVGAYASRREIMEKVAPLGSVYQAGTLSGNPVAMAAGLAQLAILESDPGIYTRMEDLAKQLADGLSEAARKAGIAVSVSRVGSLCGMFFTEGPVTGYEEAKRSDTRRYAEYFAGMLERGIYMAPSQFEAVFVSAAHTPEQIGRTVAAAEEVFAKISGR